MTSQPITGQTPTEEIELILSRIDKDVFDCGDALQNAYYTLKHRKSFDSAAVKNAEEYLREWPPVWMRDDTFVLNDVPEKIGTDKVRAYIRSLQAQCSTLQREKERIASEAFDAGFNVSREGFNAELSGGILGGREAYEELKADYLSSLTK